MGELIFSNESGVVAKLPVASLEFEEMLERMQTPEAKRARQAAFDASPLELGQAAVAQAIRKITPEDIYPWLDNLIGFPTSQGAPRTVLITSTLPSEGKTTAAFNIALELAKRAKVLMIDANLHRPRLHDVFGLENNFGLSSILSRRMTPPAVLRLIKQTDDSNVSLLPSGALPRNPGELLTSGRMQEVLEMVRKDFAYVIIDSASVQSSQEGVQLSSMVDGVMVVQGKTTSHQDVLGTVKLFERDGLVIIRVSYTWR